MACPGIEKVGDDSGQTQFIRPQVVEDVESTRQVPIEFEFHVSRHIQPRGQLVEEPLPVEPGAAAVAAGTRPAWSTRERRMRAFSVFDRDRLRPGMAFDGPAIVEEASATTIVDDGGKVEVDAYGALVIVLDLEEAP